MSNIFFQATSSLILYFRYYINVIKKYYYNTLADSLYFIKLMHIHYVELRAENYKYVHILNIQYFIKIIFVICNEIMTL